MVFFSFFEPFAFLNREKMSDIDNLTDQISALLYGLTYWGDYGGDSYSRFHYDIVSERAPHLVRNLSGNHGDALVLDRGGIEDMVSLITESDEGMPVSRETFDSERAFLKSFFEWAVGTDNYGRRNRDDFPLFDESEYHDWEYAKQEEVFNDDLDSWIIPDIRNSISRLTNYEVDSDEFTDEEITAVVNQFREERFENGYPYWESATSLVYGFNSDEVATYILDKRSGKQSE